MQLTVDWNPLYWPFACYIPLFPFVLREVTFCEVKNDFVDQFSLSRDQNL